MLPYIMMFQGSVGAGEALSMHPLIAKMTFTGSVPTGTKVMEACAKVSTWIQC
jgi:aldehyde dehydrogenase family 9 protein A1